MCIKGMSKLWRVILFTAITCTPVAVLSQDLQAPTASLHGDILKIDGQFAHIQGEMPVKGEPWFYHVEMKTDHLFVYSFWTIDIFQDTEEGDCGSYRARSWTVEVIDSKVDTETSLIFDRHNDFQFQGCLVKVADKARVTINWIDGLPENSYGPILLKILK